MRTSRLVLPLALAAAVASGHLAGAATKPLVVDPVGDAKGLGATYDIVSANLATTGITKKVGRKTTYTPTALVATVKLSAPPPSTPGYSINFFADTSACDGGYFQWSYTPGNAILGDGSLFVSGCGTDSGVGPAEFFEDAAPVIKGTTITWTLRLKEIGSDLPLKSTFTNATVYADFNDPVFGLVGTGTADGSPLNTSVDLASSTATYTLK